MTRSLICCAMAFCCSVATGSAAGTGSASPNPDVPADFHVLLHRHNGSVPPPQHRGHRIELSAAGSMTYSETVGYDGTIVSTRTLPVRPDAVAGLYALFVRRNAFTTAWTGADAGLVGGGCIWIAITAARKRVEIPCEVPQELKGAKREIAAAIEALRIPYAQ